MSELKVLERQCPFECPACFKQQHSVHVDGNKKLYRYSKVARSVFALYFNIHCIMCCRGVRDSYYNGAFQLITDNSKVDAHLHQLGYTDNTVIL